MKIHVLTLAESQPDKEPIGPHLVKILLHHFQNDSVNLSEIPCEQGAIEDALKQNSDADIILTTGGSGILPCDYVPDVTAAYCDRMLPGIAEMLRMEAYKHSPYSVLSRGTAGIKGNTIIINIPGSLKAALLCIRLLIPVLIQGVKVLRGEGQQSFEFSVK